MNIFSINDMSGFANSLRNNAAISIAENYQENLDDFISISQIEKMILSKSIGTDENNQYMITEDIFDTLFEDVRRCIYQVGLAKLAANGSIECAWDNNTNEMVFWANNTQSIS